MSDETPVRAPFITRKKTRPAIEVNCSGWADTSTGDRAVGPFVAKKKTRPAFESALQVPALRLTVSFQSGVPLERLHAVTTAMIERLHAAAPDLNLVYDTARSKSGQDSLGAPVAEIVLTPQTPPADLDQRYAALFAEIRAAAAEDAEYRSELVAV